MTPPDAPLPLVVPPDVRDDENPIPLLTHDGGPYVDTLEHGRTFTRDVDVLVLDLVLVHEVFAQYLQPANTAHDCRRRMYKDECEVVVEDRLRGLLVTLAEAPLEGCDLSL